MMLWTAALQSYGASLPTAPPPKIGAPELSGLRCERALLGQFSQKIQPRLARLDSSLIVVDHGQVLPLEWPPEMPRQHVIIVAALIALSITFAPLAAMGMHRAGSGEQLIPPLCDQPAAPVLRHVVFLDRLPDR